MLMTSLPVWFSLKRLFWSVQPDVEKTPVPPLTSTNGTTRHLGPCDARVPRPVHRQQTSSRTSPLDLMTKECLASGTRSSASLKTRFVTKRRVAPWVQHDADSDSQLCRWDSLSCPQKFGLAGSRWCCWCRSAGTRCSGAGFRLLRGPIQRCCCPNYTRE